MCQGAYVEIIFVDLCASSAVSSVCRGFSFIILQTISFLFQPTKATITGIEKKKRNIVSWLLI